MSAVPVLGSAGNPGKSNSHLSNATPIDYNDCVSYGLATGLNKFMWKVSFFFIQGDTQ